jgi:NTE family protein
MTATADAPRRALVLGGGGVLGFAWMLGALTALESVAEFDARDADLAIGTSAGSVAAALLGCRLPVEVIARHHQGVPLPTDPVIAYDYHSATGSALPPRPGWRPAAPGLIWDSLRHPGRVAPIVALSGLLPAGRASLRGVHDLVDAVATEAGYAEPDDWPTAPRPWVVVVDYQTGRRIVFGRDDLGASRDGRPRVVRRARLADAVQASCSIPGWYPPTMIDGVPYVDGGAISNASVDLLRGTDVDEVYVLAPMGSLEPDQPTTTLARLERRIRRVITRRLVADAGALRAEGKRVCLVTPDATDLEVMGVNLMDPSRREAVYECAQETARATLTRQLTAFTGSGRRRSAPKAESGETGRT